MMTINITLNYPDTNPDFGNDEEVVMSDVWQLPQSSKNGMPNVFWSIIKDLNGYIILLVFKKYVHC